MGDFTNNFFNGEGFYFFSSGAIYEGSFKNHLKNGHGKEYLVNGNFY
jgi:hypothetical protein